MTEPDIRGWTERDVLLDLAASYRQQWREKMAKHGYNRRGRILDMLSPIAAVLESAAERAATTPVEDISPERLGHEFEEWECIFCGHSRDPRKPYEIADQRCPKRTVTWGEPREMKEDSARAEAAVQRAADVVATLRNVEWSAWHDGNPCCPECRGQKAIGHKPGCRLAAVIGGTS